MDNMILFLSVQVRSYLAIGNQIALAELNSTITNALRQYIDQRGWLVEPSTAWQLKAVKMSTEMLYSEIAVGLPNLVYAAKSGNYSQHVLSQAASRFLTCLDVAHKREATLKRNLPEGPKHK